jgi:hypothetical protein
MTTEFRVTLDDKPGTLARLCTVLGHADVNIEAVQGTSGQGLAFVHFIPDDSAAAAEALERAGISFETREVLIVKILDQPGMLGDVALVMAEAGINIDAVYLTVHGNVVLGVDDLDGAIQVAGGMAVMAP